MSAANFYTRLPLYGTPGPQPVINYSQNHLLSSIHQQYQTFVQNGYFPDDPRLKTYDIRVRFLSGPIEFPEGISIFDKMKLIVQKDKQDFKDMLKRISTLLVRERLSLRGFFASSGILDEAHLFEYLWSNLREVEMTPLILKLISTDLNEAILLLAFHPSYQKAQVTSALSQSLDTLYQINEPLADFYLGILVKGHIIDFSTHEAARLKQKFNRSNPAFQSLLLDVRMFILNSLVIDLRFSDFLACGFDWREENVTETLNIMASTPFLVSINGSTTAYSPSFPLHAYYTLLNIPHTVLNGCLKQHFKSECDRRKDCFILYYDFICLVKERLPASEHIQQLLSTTYQSNVSRSVHSSF